MKLSSEGIVHHHSKAVMSGRQGGGKLLLGSAELKLERQDCETAPLLVFPLSKIVATPTTTSDLLS
jgi:hypothetical protein